MVLKWTNLSTLAALCWSCKCCAVSEGDLFSWITLVCGFGKKTIIKQNYSQWEEHYILHRFQCYKCPKCQTATCAMTTEPWNQSKPVRCKHDMFSRLCQHTKQCNWNAHKKNFTLINHLKNVFVCTYVFELSNWDKEEAIDIFTRCHKERETNITYVSKQ